MEYEPGKSVTVNIVCCALIALMLLTLFFGWVGVSERGKLYWAEFRDNFDYVTDSLEDELEDYDVSSDTQNKLIKSVNSFRDGKLSPIEALSILISTKAAIKEVGEYLGPEEAQNAILGITAITAVFAAVIILIVVLGLLNAYRAARGKGGVAPAVINSILITLLIVVFVLIAEMVNSSNDIVPIGAAHSYLSDGLVSLTLYPPLALVLSIAVIVLSAKCRASKKAPESPFNSPYVAPPVPDNELYSRCTLPKGYGFEPEDDEYVEGEEDANDY
ncbi:MAG: hypothetical protein II583_05835 [Oscillospiraceae bacterium]|nr:hypothetical protein [Oscillospiraceae bacterium]